MRQFCKRPTDRCLQQFYLWVTLFWILNFAWTADAATLSRAVASKVVSPEKLICVAGAIRLVVAGKMEVQKADYCYSDKFDALYSKNCQRGSCLKVADFVGVNRELLLGEYGAPGARLCHQLRGRSEIMEFQAGQEWYKLNRCVLREDTFLDMGSLFQVFETLE